MILVLISIFLLAFSKFYPRHKKIEGLMIEFYPNTETIKRGKYMTYPHNTLRWTIKKQDMSILEEEFVRDTFGLSNYKMQKNDSIHYVMTPKDYWDWLIGWEGLVLFRGNDPIAW